MATPRICLIEDCDKPARARGWCVAHYQRWRLHGDPNEGGPLRTSPGEVGRYFREVVLQYDGDECLIWPYGGNQYGYGQMWFRGAMRVVSRIVCEHVNGPPPSPDHQAAHSCGKGHEGCCTKRHLRWATRPENMADTLAHGTHQFGERNTRTRLTESDVRAIRAMRGGVPRREVAKVFGVHPQTVSAIQRGDNWRRPPKQPA